jgi:hypothetical protein
VVWRIAAGQPGIESSILDITFLLLSNFTRHHKDLQSLEFKESVI